MDRAAERIRRLIRGSESNTARAWQARAEEGLLQGNRIDRDRFLARFGCDEEKDRVMLGRTRTQSGDPMWCGLEMEEFLSQHGWITGATGSGKSYFVAACLLQVLRAGRNPVIIVDLKSELSEMLIETVLPALAASPAGEKFVDSIRVIRPFGSDLPALRITEPEEGVPRGIQAYNLAAALAEAVGDDLGTRMQRVFLRMAGLAIERRDPLPVIQRWLERPVEFARAARNSVDSALQSYALGGFERESRPAIDALLARLDSFLFLDEVRLSLGAPSCVSFRECLESGITIVDLGSPPAGAERVQRFWAGILLGRISRAVLSRPVTPESPAAWLVVEEAQEALTRESALQFGRLLALARHKKVGITLINQQPAQLSAVDPTLVRLLRTNAGLEFAFRCNYEDARTLVEPMPLPPGTPRSAEVRQAMAQELVRMPVRSYLLWAKREPFGAQQVRSPRLDLASLRAEADRIDPALRERIRKGSVSIPRAELEKMAEAESVTSPVSDLLGLVEDPKVPRVRHPKLG
jgi:hypothetical protein